MSAAEIERFVDDLKKSAELQLELKGKATGIGAVGDFAKSKGYAITPQEIKDYIRSRVKAPLSDAQLEAIAGGGVAAVNTNVAVEAEVDVAVAVDVVIFGVGAIVI